MEMSALNYWLVKSEPNTWSWDDHTNAPNATAEWDGVRNHQAKNNLKAMAVGDRAMFYHSVKAREVVGVLEVVKEHYPDPSDPSGKFVMVDFKAIAPMPTPVSLADIKAEDDLQEMRLIKQSRLSVMPMTAEEWAKICEMGDWEEPASGSEDAGPSITDLPSLEAYLTSDGFPEDIREKLHYSHELDELVYSKDDMYNHGTLCAATWATLRERLPGNWYVQLSGDYPKHKGRSRRNDKADVMIWSPEGDAIPIEIKTKHGKPVDDAAKKIAYHLGVGSSAVALGLALYADYETENDFSEVIENVTVRGVSLIWY